jgi:hypothetical protein
MTPNDETDFYVETLRQQNATLAEMAQLLRATRLDLEASGASADGHAYGAQTRPQEDPS